MSIKVLYLWTQWCAAKKLWETFLTKRTASGREGGSVRKGGFERFYNWELSQVGHVDLPILEWADGELHAVRLWAQRLRNLGFENEAVFHFWNIIWKSNMRNRNPNQNLERKGKLFCEPPATWSVWQVVWGLWSGDYSSLLATRFSAAFSPLFFEII